VLKVTKQSNQIHVETGGAIFEWDLTRGGQIVRCDLKNPQQTHPLITNGDCAGNLTLELPDKTVSLADAPVEVTYTREDDDCLIFQSTAKLAGIFTVQQQWEVFHEGVVFCDFGVFVDPDQKTVVRNAQMNFALDVLSARNMRGNYLSRDHYLKQDVTTLHVFSDSHVCLERDAALDMPHLLALFGLDLGWDETRYFSNRVELLIEDSTSWGDDMLGPTRTIAGPRDGQWQLTWHLCQDCSQEVAEPFFYRNRWALLCGSARSEAGPDADPARRNNVMAARICHVMYPYVREGKDWPLVSIPVKQVFYQDAQIAKENPSLERIDEAAALGANVLIIHQFWMNNGGSNGEPMADYKVHDPEWFKAFVGRAHDKGMRVALYMRGVEHYSLYMDFFEEYMQRNWDGLYADWATPFGLGYAKGTSRHCSAHNWFVFCRCLRERVGPNGILISHTAIQTFTSNACFDAVMCGEFSVMHAGLLHSPEISTSYAMLGGCGVNLIAGDAPDRKIFSSQQSASFSAGLGYSNHPFMAPNIEFKDANAYIQPLWDIQRHLPEAPVRSFNPAIGTGVGLTWSDDKLHPLAYQTADKTTLLQIANISDTPASGTVEVDLAKLGLPDTARLHPLDVKGTHLAQTNGHRVTIENMPPYFFTGVLIK